MSMFNACSSQLKQPIFGRSWYQIKSYDTLYSIAWHYGLDVKDLARWNKINPPYTIKPGQRILLYEAPQQAAQSGVIQNDAGTNRKVIPITVSTKKPDKVKLPEVLFEQWPTAGKVSQYFSSKTIDRKGIDIKGNINQPVYAVASGKVVYSGNGLADYGNLIIIKHTETFLSAYAHNNNRLVAEGAKVNRGAKIATMGRNDIGETLLHFQIRRNGKPVNPLKYLPKSNKLLKQ